MGDFTQFFWAMVDSTQAAMIGLNLVPVLVLSLFIGLVQRKRGFSWLKAALAVLPAIAVAAMWPAVYGAQAIWPDFSQIEAEIQLGVLYAVATAVIAVAGLIKGAIPPLSLDRLPKVVPVPSES